MEIEKLREWMAWHEMRMNQCARFSAERERHRISMNAVKQRISACLKFEKTQWPAVFDWRSFCEAHRPKESK